MPQADPRKRWLSLPLELRQRVESHLGPMPSATLHDIPESEALDYAIGDAIGTRGIYPRLLARAHSLGLDRIFLIDMGAVPMFHHMQKTGILVRPGHFEALSEYLREQMEECAGRVKQLASLPSDDDFSVSSDDQVADLLFSRLHLPAGRLTPTGKRYKVDGETLGAIQHLHPVVSAILEWREYETLETNFCHTLPQHVGPDGRVRGDFKLTRQKTGRLSVAEPHLLNLPREDKDNPISILIREGFIAGEGNVIGSWDYGQLEGRILAHLSEDKLLISRFSDDTVDFFRATASDLMGKPPSSITKDERDFTKMTFYLIIYGGRGENLSLRLRATGKQKSARECDRFIEEIFKLYPGAQKYIWQAHAEARRTGMVRDLFGRIRYVQQVHSIKRRDAEEGLRQAQNHCIQSAASGIMKLAMARCWEWLRGVWGTGRVGSLNDPLEIAAPVIDPILQVHDELLWELHNSLQETAGPEIKRLMEGAYELRVPLRAKYAFAPSWGEIEK